MKKKNVSALIFTVLAAIVFLSISLLRNNQKEIHNEAKRSMMPVETKTNNDPAAATPLPNGENASMGGVVERIIADDAIKGEMLKMDKAMEKEQFFAGVKEFDENRMKNDLSEADLAAMTTAQAIESFMSKPFMVVMDYHTDDVGIERLLRVSNSLKALIEREDFPAAILDLMRKDILDPDEIENPDEYLDKTVLEQYRKYLEQGVIKSIPEKKYMAMGVLITQYRRRSTLLMHPRILKKLMGYEADLVRELARQHRKMVEVDNLYREKVDENDNIHGINTTINFRLALSLIEQMDETLLDTANAEPLREASSAQIGVFYQEIIGKLESARRVE